MNLQRLFVQKCVEADLVNRRDPTLFRYFFTINGRRIRVCQLFFLSTLAIQSNFVTDALNIIFEEKSTAESEEKRLQPKIIEGVINHIKSIPRIISCNINSKGEREYFETSIKLDTMFNLYLKYSKDNKYPLASFEVYKEIFASKNEIFKKCQDSVPLLEANEVTLITLKADKT